MQTPMDFWKFLRLLIPTLCLAYVVAGSTWGNSASYRYAFGEGDYFLDLYFDTNPHGYFQRQLPNRSLPFFGYFVHGDRQEKVRGKFTHDANGERYVFQTSLGKFVGSLAAPRSGCEPQLNFRIAGNGDPDPKRSGSLKAAYCN